MNNRGLSLIIAVFGVMLLGVLAWSLAAMLGGNLDSGLRALRSEQALYCAESGMQWARLQLANNSSWRTSSDDDCADTGDWLVHSFGPGQYAVCSRNATLAESTDGPLAVEVRGYVPSQSAYQARREVKLIASFGGFDQVLQTNGGVFNWTGVTASSEINDDLTVEYFEGDGDGVYNEADADYRSTLPLRPPAASGMTYARQVGVKQFPALDMNALEQQAAALSQVWEPPMTAKIVSVTPVGTANEYILDLDRSVFTETNKTLYNGSWVRTISRGSWNTSASGALITSVTDGDTVRVQQAGLSWLPGERISVVPVATVSANYSGNNRTYTVTVQFDYFASSLGGNLLRNLNRGSWDYLDWGTITYVNARSVKADLNSSVTSAQMQANLWTSGCLVSVGKRYTKSDGTGQGPLQQKTIWFLGSDVLFDTNGGSIDGRKTAIIAQGDIVIRGTNGLAITDKQVIYPNLATQNGQIWSPDHPGGSSRQSLLKARSFVDVVFSENGPVVFDCLQAAGVLGKSVTLRGEVQLNYIADLPRLRGFSWGISQQTWNEQ